MMAPRFVWVNLDDLEAAVMAICAAIGAKARKRHDALRAGGFDVGEPMQ